MAERERILDETGRISRLLVRSAEGVKANFAFAVQPLGLSVPAARALLNIAKPTPMRELAAQLAFDPSYLTGLADELEESGFVVRVAGADRRVKLLQLTDAGEAMRRRIGTAVAADEPLAVRLDSADRVHLARILERLLAE